MNSPEPTSPHSHRIELRGTLAAVGYPGGDETAQPRILIHSTREQIAASPGVEIGAEVVVVRASDLTAQGTPTDAHRDIAARCLNKGYKEFADVKYWGSGIELDTVEKAAQLIAGSEARAVAQIKRELAAAQAKLTTAESLNGEWLTACRHLARDIREPQDVTGWLINVNDVAAAMPEDIQKGGCVQSPMEMIGTLAESRDEWKQRAEAAEARVKELEAAARAADLLQADLNAIDRVLDRHDYPHHPEYLPSLSVTRIAEMAGQYASVKSERDALREQVAMLREALKSARDERPSQKWQLDRIDAALGATPESIASELAKYRALLESIGEACGFPKVSDHAQLTETIIKRVVRIASELAALREDREAVDWIGAEGQQWDRYDRVLAHWHEGVSFRDAIKSAMAEGSKSA